MPGRAPGRLLAVLIGAGVTVSLPLQEGSVGELVGPGWPWRPFSHGGAGRRSPGRAQLAGAALWRFLAVLVVLIGAPVAVSIPLQEGGVGVNVGYVGMRSAWGALNKKPDKNQTGKKKQLKIRGGKLQQATTSKAPKALGPKGSRR